MPLLKKMRVYNALVNSIANRNRMAEAVELCLSVLKKLYCTFPKSSASVTLSTVVGLLRTRSKIKALTANDNVSSLPLMSCGRKAETMTILNMLALYCYFSKASPAGIGGTADDSNDTSVRCV